MTYNDSTKILAGSPERTQWHCDADCPRPPEQAAKRLIVMHEATGWLLYHPRHVLLLTIRKQVAHTTHKPVCFCHAFVAARTSNPGQASSGRRPAHPNPCAARRRNPIERSCKRVRKFAPLYACAWLDPGWPGPRRRTCIIELKRMETHATNIYMQFIRPGPPEARP